MAPTVRPGQLGMATPFGELLGSSDQEMNAQIQDYVDIGVDWVRLDIHWSLVQPTANGGFNWNLVDKVFNALDNQGIKITAVLNNTPDWVDNTLSSTFDQQAFGRFAGAAAERYDHVVDHWEILNEQNKHGITPENYTRVLEAAYDQIKAVNGNDVVITGGTAAIPSTDGRFWGAVDYLEKMYDAGAGGHFDAVGFHPYTFPLFPSDNQAWNGWQIMEDGIRKTMVDNGDGDMQVWMTEYGAKTLGGGVTVSEQDQARMLREAVDLAEDQPWAGPIMWFQYQDSDFEPGFGLRDSNGNPREAYYAFRDLARRDGDDASAAPITPDVDDAANPDDAGNRDSFVFRDLGNQGILQGWDRGDLIDLSAIEAPGDRSNAVLNFVGSEWLQGAGDLGVYIDYAQNKTYIQSMVDDDGDIDLNIVLNGTHQLTANDFIL
ncbi:cellulase family glycosylhydrolase [Paracoccus nototheniae]|uniref:Cellulase family glycosylhydrolase n=2 Tax=Paracoccus nototheniae TaxID=2489002 RepID=A0ABW4E0F3_9RHOB